ncbi:Endochitinase 1 [Bulinus truncatus]|nr:Endochitinase 1 [Bulinus truncatus]
MYRESHFNKTINNTRHFGQTTADLCKCQAYQDSTPFSFARSTVTCSYCTWSTRVDPSRWSATDNSAVKMRLAIVLIAIWVWTFVSVFGEKCQRRVCHLQLSIYTDMNRELSKRGFPVYCTHVILHRAQVTDKQEIHLSIAEGLKEVNEAIEIKRNNPQLKLILAIQNDNSADFVKMYTTDEYKKTFIRNIIKYVRDKTIDGVKIDVQPAEGGDKEKFTRLFKDLKAAFTTEASNTNKQKLLLSVGIPSDKSFLDKYNDVLEISKYVDMVDLATYNFVDVSKKIASLNPTHHSPLYSNDKHSIKTIDFMAKYVAGKGVKKYKINIGLSFIVTLYDGDIETKEYTPTSTLGYYSIACGLSKSGDITKLEPDKGRVLNIASKKGFYDWKQFYDDSESIKEKVRYVKANGYGGILLYRIDDDDYRSECRLGHNPLSKAAYEECIAS